MIAGVGDQRVVHEPAEPQHRRHQVTVEQGRSDGGRNRIADDVFHGVNVAGDPSDWGRELVVSLVDKPVDEAVVKGAVGAVVGGFPEDQTDYEVVDDCG